MDYIDELLHNAKLKVAEPDETVKKLNLFDVLNDITYKKDGIVNEENSKLYEPYFILKGLSQNMDTLLLANEVNKRPNMPPLQQYKFFLKTIPAAKRYGKWVKAEDVYDSDDVMMVSRHYKISTDQALDYINISNGDIIEYVKNLNYTGGV